MDLEHFRAPHGIRRVRLGRSIYGLTAAGGPGVWEAEVIEDDPSGGVRVLPRQVIVKSGLAAGTNRGGRENAKLEVNMLWRVHDHPEFKCDRVVRCLGALEHDDGVMYYALERVPGCNLFEWMARRKKANEERARRGGCFVCALPDALVEPPWLDRERRPDPVKCKSKLDTKTVDGLGCRCSLSSSLSLNEPQSKILIREIARALLPMHRQGVAHLDLKPENIMIDPSWNPVNPCDDDWKRQPPKLTILDLGHARSLPARRHPVPGTGGGSSHKLPRTIAERGFGTRGYAAPEVRRGNFDPFAADMWSLGIILFIFISGLVPFKSNSGPVSRRELENTCRDLVTSQGLDVLCCLLSPENERPRLNKFIEHPWFMI
jgi:serine/threonine protein kinase